MVWSGFSMDVMFKRSIGYLLKRFLGQYIVDFSQDELNYSLKSGKGSIENVLLDCEALNELFEEYNLPIELQHGSIASVVLSIPWTNMFGDNTLVDLKGIRIVAQPKERPVDVSMFESVWGSMTSSLQLAEDCLKNSNAEDDEEIGDGQKTTGVQKMAQIIDTFMANMKVRLHDTSVKIEYVPGTGPHGIALEIKIASAEYFDEAGLNGATAKDTSDKTYEPQAFSFKKLIFEGVSLFTSQFSARAKAASKISVMSCRTEASGFVPGSPEMPPTHSTLPVKKVEADLQDEEPILISKLNGRQILRLKLKQKEEVIGPKVDVEFNLGAFNLFLIPQQVHMLYELINGLMRPCSNNETSCRIPLSVPNKPLKQSDFDLLGQQILRQQQKLDMPSKSLKTQQGWSSHSLDLSDDEFQLMASENKFLNNLPTPVNDNDSMCSSVSSDTRSDWSSNCLGTNVKPSKHRGSTVQAMLQDQLSELTHFRGSCSSICIIILHDDSVQESLSKASNDATDSNPNPTLSLKERAERFFEDLLGLQMSGMDFTDFTTAREPLSSICATNHLRLMATSLMISGNEMSSSAQCIVNFTLSLYQFEILECLFNSANIPDKPQMPTYVPVLTSNKKVTEEENTVEGAAESFKLSYVQTQYTTQSSLVKPPANKLDIRFGPTTCEFDISLTDRIQTLLNFQNTFSIDSKNDDWHNSDVGSITRSSTKTELTISSPNLIVNVRFPIPDLRSVHDINRVPWWQQNLHKEVLILDAKDVTFITALDGDVTQSKYEVQCRDLHGLIKLSDTDEPISFLRVSADPEVDEVPQDGGFDWPRLVIRSTSRTDGGALERELDEEAESNLFSLSDVLMSNMDTEPSPFRSTPVVYGSKLQKNNQEKAEKGSMSLDHDEVIKPADKETMSHFMEEIVNKSKCLLEFFLPTVNIVFPSKDLFELLYNRLGNDLLLWERTASTPKASYDPNGFRVHIPGLDLNGTVPIVSDFTTCPSFEQFSNDSNSDSEEEIEESNYYSVFEYCQRRKDRHKKKSQNNALTKLSISFAITKGNLTVHTPVQDNAANVLPDICGILQLNVQDGCIFIASSYKGDPNESYFCVTSEKSILYHKESTAQLSKVSIVEPLSSSKPSNLNCIIYATEQGMRLKSPVCDMVRYNDMLKIAVHVVHSPKQQLKSFKVAIDISNATLRHYMHSVPQMWINQLIDFLKVQDFPVNGYVPSAVVTEFHLNLSNCAIDYRPLHLPLRCAITVDNFNMSCNIAAMTPSFLFRLISEEMRLFISNDVTAKKGDLQKKYVCVIDSGLIDVSFRTSLDEKNEPKLELCATNNIIHVRTCSDSFKALVDLMIYASTNGDLDTNDEEQVEETKPATVHQATDSDNLHLLMAEAMKDCPTAAPQDVSGLQKSTGTIADLDDEFCILENDPGVGLLPKDGEPQIRMLTNSPIVIVENHFSVPPGKSDVLKAPEHYPKPRACLALREMSVVWQLYGGKDFTYPKGKGSKKSKDHDSIVTFADEKNVNVDTGLSSVAFCKVTPMSKKFDVNNVHYSLEHVSLDPNIEANTISWLKKGGPNRDHDVLMELQMNKIRFQRDTYGPFEEKASRYVLLVNDIEIRDRLKSSNYNKFLYQYTSQKIPRQSHANMVEVKATYTRPDPKLNSEECSMNISCKPLRLNVDQDSLLFLLSFFKEALGIDTEETEEESNNSQSAEKNSNTVNQQKESPVTPRRASVSSSNETFYRYFSFNPEVLIRIDYQGKRVLMEQGALKGLLFGLAKLNASEIKLKSLCYRHGLLGHHKVLSYATGEWHQDIMATQLPSILGGVGPFNSFVQLFQGVKDFFYLPVAQYQRDGQIVRGLQLGASSFSTSALMAALDLFSGLVSTIQGAAIIGYDMVSPGPSVANRYQRNSETYHQASQPADIREGITSALNVVREGFGDAARAIYCVAYTEHEHKGVPGAVGGVLRQIPPTLFKPIILGSEATNYVLGGVRHQLMPDAHQEDIHKWRSKNS